jgi:hypothetical protein
MLDTNNVTAFDIWNAWSCVSVCSGLWCVSQCQVVQILCLCCVMYSYQLPLWNLCVTVHGFMCHNSKPYVSQFTPLCVTVHGFLYHSSQPYVSQFTALCVTVHNFMCHSSRLYAQIFNLIAGQSSNRVNAFGQWSLGSEDRCDVSPPYLL